MTVPRARLPRVFTRITAGLPCGVVFTFVATISLTALGEDKPSPDILPLRPSRAAGTGGAGQVGGRLHDGARRARRVAGGDERRPAGVRPRVRLRRSRRRRRRRARSLFRIASVSKPITAVAILQLVERGKLKLSDKIVDVLKMEPHLEEGAKLDERWKDVTIEHCLLHTGGWNRDKSYDPMFQAPRMAKSLEVELPIEPAHVIRYMLGQPLDFDPGAQYAYSNFGYCLLGRVIEKVIGPALRNVRAKGSPRAAGSHVAADRQVAGERAVSRRSASTDDAKDADGTRHHRPRAGKGQGARRLRHVAAGNARRARRLDRLDGRPGAVCRGVRRAGRWRTAQGATEGRDGARDVQAAGRDRRS